MNNDLISREALKKHITDIFEREVEIDEKWARGLKYSLKIIDSAPTVEPERPQGEWIRLSNRLYECKNCGYISDYKYPFCHCGADMRVKNELKMS